jgi:hypothetical protein
VIHAVEGRQPDERLDNGRGRARARRAPSPRLMRGSIAWACDRETAHSARVTPLPPFSVLHSESVRSDLVGRVTVSAAEAFAAPSPSSHSCAECFMAQMAAWVRLRTRTLRKIALTWTLTVAP